MSPVDAEPVYAVDGDTAANWVLVPREHLRTMQSWNGEIDEVDAILMCAAIFRDAVILEATKEG
jgi:hypothetical protein